MKIGGLKERLEKVEQRDSNKFGMLQEMNFGYNMYAGTADPEKVRRRRAKNKVGRKQRRINRARGK